MIVTVQNAVCTLQICTLGAQMWSLRDKTGREYLWNGDPAYWPDRAPVLFPFVGRLTEGKYRIGEEIYAMKIHGFASEQEFTPEFSGDDAVTMWLSDNEETRAQYPFRFRFGVTYRLREDTVEVTYAMENTGDTPLFFGYGGHPGFRAPLDAGEQFTDYALEFSKPCRPDRVGFTEAVYLSGTDSRYPLEEDRRIALRHDLFDEDAIILKNMAREVTLRSRLSGHGVTVGYPTMPYLGIWHWPHTDAPYVCIEPWTSLPSRQDVVEDITCKSDMIRLPAGECRRDTWYIRIL